MKNYFCTIDGEDYTSKAKAARVVGVSSTNISYRVDLLYIKQDGKPITIHGHKVSLKTEPIDTETVVIAKVHHRGDQLLAKRPEAWYGIGRGEA